MQDRFVARLFKAVKKMGVHTALETNGYYGDRLSDEEIADIDLLILDVKALAPEQHKRVTGVQANAAILSFARRLAAQRRPMWLRYVLVPGLTDDVDEMKGLAEFGASLGTVDRLEILPFHQLGQYKWERLGLKYGLPNASPPSQEQIDLALAIFKAGGLPTV